MSIKFADVLSSYDGEGDFGEWIKKVELVAQLQNVKNLASFFPLFLSGGAFAVYQGLEESVKKDYNAAKAKLLAAFSVDCFCAYDEMSNRRLRPGESVDVYLADLKRLAALIDEFLSDDFMKCAFVSGLPENIKLQLRAACSMKTMKLEEVVERARSLMRSSEMCMSADMKQASQHNAELTQASHVSKKQIQCYNCQGFGHVRRDCRQERIPQKQTTQHSYQRERPDRHCFVCGERTHLSGSCPDRVRQAKNV